MALGYMEEQNLKADEQRAAGLRGTTEDERWLLNHVTMFGSDGYPIRKLDRKWTWGPVRSVPGPPACWKTKREVVASFEAFLGVLRDALAGKI